MTFQLCGHDLLEEKTYLNMIQMIQRNFVTWSLRKALGCCESLHLGDLACADQIGSTVFGRVGYKTEQNSGDKGKPLKP